MKKFLISCLIVITTYFPVTSATAEILTIPGGQIEYYRFGHGKPLIMITGYFANVCSWDKDFLEALAAKHEVIVFDNRNVGGSVTSSPSYTTDALAEDVQQLIMGLHLSQVDVFGISMGGMIAQQFALNYPKSVDHLILMNTFAPGIAPTHPNQEVETTLSNPPKSTLGLYFMALKIFFPPEERVRMLFALAMNRYKPEKSSYRDLTPPKTVIKQQQELMRGWIENHSALRKFARLNQLKMPILLLSGGDDTVIPYANMDLLKKLLPHSQLMRWDRGGHIMMYQYPLEIAAVINKWLT